ncbi:Pimeloyl-ACP methyl ester carboxylesterase [Malonomonas rubra DSM 5091]|uniref:Pimeloyl-ACP methyl ester carboxylesterase n=1 Tax=Malonomonas rubra DSM 5091 TaxID=1122189 RepID=A0A1M6LNY8_MALRU|nr:alpha/beta hydrolase [Malonomonas rubra]SHJ72909.1 Pimeloyl-ACP methyl ester carboxylesterase [Malonomonas rubra DSM 5091]
MRATINGVQIGYDDYGQGPTVLFIHDCPLNRRMWQPQVEPLVNAGYRVVLVDLRGFGESELESEEVAIHTYSADIVGLLNYLGIGRAVVCGLALGGTVLFDLMENYPKRIAGACLATSRPVSDDIQETAKRTELISALQSGKEDQVKEEMFCMLIAGQEKSLPATIKDEVRGWIKGLKGKTLDVALKAIGQRKDYTPLLKGVKIPTLLVGADQDPITHHNHTDLMAEQLPNCYKAVKLSGGHFVNMERAAEFNALFLEFLENLSPKRKMLVDVDEEEEIDFCAVM